jgi:signal transduction histidine kinase
MGMERKVEEARRLERQLVALRWLVAAFGAFEVGKALGRGTGGRGSVPLALAIVVGIAWGNVLIRNAISAAATAGRARGIGVIAFALDASVLLGLVWLSSEGPADPVWVAGYLLPLEAAARWGLPGAVVGAVLFGGGELARETYLASGHPTLAAGMSVVAFRAGMAFVVGSVAGAFASGLRRQAEVSEARAAEADEIRRRGEEAALRERQARGEVAALHAAVLATPTDEQLERSLQAAAEAIARELGCDALGVLLREPGIVGETAFVALGVFGDPGYLPGERIHPASSRIARIAEAGVSSREGDDAVAPMRVQGEVIGAIHERVAEGVAADDDRLLLLGRLADQLGLVLESARLRADQDETLTRLEELDEMKGDFVAITSHELRTPLAGIRGFVDMLRRRGDELSAAEREEFLELVLMQTDRLVRLVDDLLVVSRVEAGRLTLEPEDTDLHAFCERLVRGFGREAARVDLQPASSAPLRMLVDPQRLAQILTNLIHNALKFAPQDTSVVLSWEAPSEGIVTFRVRDHGPGIPDSELERIFERFHQTEHAISHTEGFGLGLYITKQLAEAMGGWVDVASAVGDGTTFTVTLPARRELPTAARPSPAGRPGRTAS